MIPPGLSEPNSESANWRNELRQAIRSAGELCDLLGLKTSAVMGRIDSTPEFPVLVPRSFAARMRRGDAADPLLLQVLARQREREDISGFAHDPLEERGIADAGIIQKYAGRALLIATGACPVHCRYCFRRHFPYSDQLATKDRWNAALDFLRKSDDVEEVILSGGDPLSLSTARLRELTSGLEEIESITTLRIHTRFPIALPARVTPSLLTALAETRLRTVVVVHCNHANELAAADVHTALCALHASVDALLNQSVLLRDINDSVSALKELSKALLGSRVLPYYLHLLDRVSGSAHFEVPADEAIALVSALRNELPGYLVPTLVREEPGALSKTPQL